ncbi:MAG TPA: glycosyltransferase [Flavitalea sp.]|nr:glycosyltransferase [Flavitalea sp.]
MHKLNLIFFSHPPFLCSQSMPRFARMLSEGMQHRGHTVEVWAPRPVFYKLPITGGIKKWLGYIDQFLLFPIRVSYRLRKCSPDTLFIFTDHALGPWVPLVVKRPHVIHCHDFLAQQSALGTIRENRTSYTGRLYQSFIFKGYSKGKNFISVSKKTRQDLHQLLRSVPTTSAVVYNGMNQTFSKIDAGNARRELGDKFQINLSNGFLLHVGGNQWYKNRKGVIKLYDAWRKMSKVSLPLLLIGEAPDAVLIDIYERSQFKNEIYFLSGVEDYFVRMAYAGATVFVFPSFAEGFGWPIAEAMVSGCPVITTGEAPMTEVGKDIAFYIPRYSDADELLWASEGAIVIEKVVNLPERDRDIIVSSGIEHCKSFDYSSSIQKIEQVYLRVISSQQ